MSETVDGSSEGIPAPAPSLRKGELTRDIHEVAGSAFRYRGLGSGIPARAPLGLTGARPLPSCCPPQAREAHAEGAAGFPGRRRHDGEKPILCEVTWKLFMAARPATAESTCTFGGEAQPRLRTRTQRPVQRTRRRRRGVRGRRLEARQAGGHPQVARERGRAAAIRAAEDEGGEHLLCLVERLQAGNAALLARAEAAEADGGRVQAGLMTWWVPVPDRATLPWPGFAACQAVPSRDDRRTGLPDSQPPRRPQPHVPQVREPGHSSLFCEPRGRRPAADLQRNRRHDLAGCRDGQLALHAVGARRAQVDLVAFAADQHRGGA